MTIVRTTYRYKRPRRQKKAAPLPVRIVRKTEPAARTYTPEQTAYWTARIREMLDGRGKRMLGEPPAEEK